MNQVLVISYYFPPSGGPGVQRVLKFVRYLRDFGWEPTVLTVRNGAYPERDPSLLDEVPPGVTVHRTAWWDPFRGYARLMGTTRQEAVALGSVAKEAPDWKERLGRWVRANLFVPDARVGWVPFGWAAGRRLVAQESFDAVLTSGPPHSTHLIGWGVHRASGVPWVADFRDPWTDINYYAELPHTAWARRLDAALERGVLRTATRVTSVGPGCEDLLASKVEGDRAGRFVVVHNGYDEADLAGVAPKTLDGFFTLTYTGSLYASRNPTTLWQVLAGLRAGGAVPRLRLRLVGKIDEVVFASLRAYGLDAIAEHTPYVPHEDAVAFMKGGTLLLLTIEPYAQAGSVITGKLYEYMASGRPVLALGPVGGDADTLLHETGAGTLFDWSDTESMARFIRAHYEAWAQGQPRQGADLEAVEAYSRRAQTGRLAEVLDAAVREDRR